MIKRKTSAPHESFFLITPVPLEKLEFEFGETRVTRVWRVRFPSACRLVEFWWDTQKGQVLEKLDTVKYEALKVGHFCWIRLRCRFWSLCWVLQPHWPYLYCVWRFNNHLLSLHLMEHRRQNCQKYLCHPIAWNRRLISCACTVLAKSHRLVVGDL